MGKSSKHIPIRTCIGCRQKYDKYSLIRIVQNEDGSYEIDFNQTKNGRGFYICPICTCLRISIRKLNHYRKRISLSPNQQSFLQNQVEDIIQKDKIFSLVGLARKAGKVAIGQTASEAVIKKKQAQLVFVAIDASENTRNKFDFLSKQAKIKCENMGSKSEWGNLFGRESVAVFAILHRGFARAIWAEIQDKN